MHLRQGIVVLKGRRGARPDVACRSGSARADGSAAVGNGGAGSRSRMPLPPISFALEQPPPGPVNVVAPGAVTNRDSSRPSDGPCTGRRSSRCPPRPSRPRSGRWARRCSSRASASRRRGSRPPASPSRSRHRVGPRERARRLRYPRDRERGTRCHRRRCRDGGPRLRPRLTAAGREPLVLERSHTIGGRVRTDAVDGFLLDHGFQVLPAAYREARAVLDLDRLDLGLFERGAIIRSEDDSAVSPTRATPRYEACARSPVG